ncbi:MAG: Abi family protein [Alphaproteobacteria bacterium]|nr:Abi family protein [Alphaproteobacteria bacterium]MCB9795957.1 Abi family protein [Alphaproteobacteria bacterium]
MRFEKPALSLDDQVTRLLDRGLHGEPERMKEKLSSVSYYRLSVYWHVLRQSDRSFKDDASFETAWRLYTFDRELRVLTMDLIERFEIAVRTRLAEAHAVRGGPFAYAEDPTRLFESQPREREKFFRHLKGDVDGSHEAFIQHFRDKYADCHEHPPVWVACEVLTLGGLLSLYKGSPRQIRKEVADFFSLPEPVFGSWLLSIHAIRNVCAHHGRLWNRHLGAKPKLPLKDHDPDWHVPVPVPNTQVFAVLTMLVYCLHRIAAGSLWVGSFEVLLAKYPEVDVARMGFLPEWRTCPIWARMHPAPG